MTALPNGSAEVRSELAGLIQAALEPLIAGRAGRICLIDPPGHPNVGDSAILLGELAFLRRSFPAARLSYQDCETYSEKADRQIEAATMLLLHGGGNFGDLWPRHHNLRKTILRRFPHKTIVQLPQSLHFDDPAELQETASLIAGQSDFTLLTRDQASYDLASSRFACRTLLVPDMAFALRSLRRKSPIVDCICLFRTDKEKIADHDAALAVIKDLVGTVEVWDWIEDRSSLRRTIDHAMRRVVRRSYPAAAAAVGPASIATRRSYAADRVRFGTSVLCRGDVVVTDRLHAHILCCLLGIPHVALDSLGGKVSAFYKAWTCRYECARIISALDELPDELRRLRGALVP